jgi:hypothetical protein
MDPSEGREFAIAVNLPRAYFGNAGLRVGPESVTLIARPIRYFRTVVYSSVAVIAVLMVPVLAMPGPLVIRAAVYGLIMGPLFAGIMALLRSSGGDSRAMSLPLASVSLAKRNGRVLVLNAAFDSQMRAGKWTIVAATRDEAEAIALALKSGNR